MSSLRLERALQTDAQVLALRVDRLNPLALDATPQSNLRLTAFNRSRRFTAQSEDQQPICNCPHKASKAGLDRPSPVKDRSESK
jgi:hypothetical protein